MEINNKNYRHWKIKALVVANYDDTIATDILHTVLERVNKKDINQIDNLDNYIFISLKNTHTRYMTSKSKHNKKTVSLEDINTSEDIYDFDEVLEYENLYVKRMNSANRVYETLNTFDKQLYDLHFFEGLSQRSIARGINVHHNIINKKINIIKSKIKLDYDQNN